MRFELFDHLNKHQYLTIEKFYKLYQQRYSLIFKIAENLNNPLHSLSKAAVLLRINEKKNSGEIAVPLCAISASVLSNINNNQPNISLMISHLLTAKEISLLTRALFRHRLNDVIARKIPVSFQSVFFDTFLIYLYIYVCVIMSSALDFPFIVAYQTHILTSFAMCCIALG